MKSKMAICEAIVAALLAGCGVDRSPTTDYAGAEPAAAQQEKPEVAQQPEAAEASLAHSECIAASDSVTAAMLDCSRAELDRQDARLNAVYKEAMAATADRDSLRAIQRQWIKDRDVACEGDGEVGGTAGELNRVGCLVQETERRANELAGVTADPEPGEHAGPIHANWLEEIPPEEEAPAAEETPVRLSLQDKVGPGYSVITYLVIQSTVDEVAVSAVEVNRGNCIALMTMWEPGAHYPTHKEVDAPITLKFGGELRLQPSCRSILEAKVSTTRGDYEFSFADAH